jgi:hypothetical protein
MTIRSWITLRNISVNSSDIQPTASSSSVQTVPPFPVTDGDKNILQGMIVGAIEQSYAFMVKDIVFINATWLSFGNSSQGPLAAVLLFETNVNVSNYCFDNEAFTVIREEIDQSLVNKTHFFIQQTSLFSSQITTTFTQLMTVLTIPTNSSYCDAFILQPSPSPTNPPTFPPRFSNSNSQNSLNPFSTLSNHPDISLAVILAIVLFVIGTLIYMIISNREKPLLSTEYLVKMISAIGTPIEQNDNNYNPDETSFIETTAVEKEKYQYGEVISPPMPVSPSSNFTPMYYDPAAVSSNTEANFPSNSAASSQEFVPDYTNIDMATYCNTYYNQSPGFYENTFNLLGAGSSLDPADVNRYYANYPMYTTVGSPTSQEFMQDPGFNVGGFDPLSYNDFNWDYNQNTLPPNQEYPGIAGNFPPSLVTNSSSSAIVNKYKPIFPPGFGMIHRSPYHPLEQPSHDQPARYLVPEQSATSIVSSGSIEGRLQSNSGQGIHPDPEDKDRFFFSMQEPADDLDANQLNLLTLFEQNKKKKSKGVSQKTLLESYFIGKSDASINSEDQR